jgi:hypothetical protein
MSELPKIALKRLKAAAPPAQATGSGTGPFQGSQHPDANLLSAFAEQSLTNPERELVLEHVSHCAECREVTALMLPAETEGAVLPQVAPERRWNLWPALRWGSLVAALGVVTIVVGLHSNRWRSNREAGVTAPPAASAAKAPEPLQAYAPAPSALPESRDKTAPEKVEKEKDALRRRSEEMDSRNQLELPAKKEVSKMTASRPPADLRLDNAPVASISRHQSLGDRAMSASAPTVPLSAIAAAPPPPPPTAPATASVSAGKTSADSASPTATVEVTSQAPTLQSETTQEVELAGGALTKSASTAASGAPKSAAQPGEQSKAEPRGGMFGVMAARRSLKASASGAVWSVSNSGKVQRSTDGTKTFGTVEINAGTKFIAVASLGDEVWAGGEAAALFVSHDDGYTWKKIKVASASSELAESIAAIKFSSPQNLTIITTSGAQWTTVDAGHHWNQLP